MANIDIIRHSKDGKKYLYDIINLKKKQSTPHRQMPYGRKPVSFYEYYYNLF